MKLSFFPLLAALILSGCGGSGISGEYGRMRNGQWETDMLFRNGSVEIDFGLMTMVGTYEVRDDRVQITINGATQSFAIDGNGCIQGGILYGTLCRKP